MIKTIPKSIIKYISIFLATVLILILLLVGVAKIPKDRIIQNLEQSTSYFKEYRFEIEETQKRRDYTFIHPYADSMILNIIACLDTNKPLQSVMEAKYYSKDGYEYYANSNFIDVVENNAEPSTEYIRYWHGSIIIIKLLLMIFNLNQIYVFNYILLGILILTLITLLIKKKHVLLAISFLIGLIMTVVCIVPQCLEYTWMYLLMLIISIISVIIEKKRRQKNIRIIFCIRNINVFL